MPLQEMDQLNKTAKIKACDMVERNYFSHEDPDGRMPWYLFIKMGVNYKYAGENIASGYTDSENEELVEDWMASPTHRKNILNKEYQYMGIATCGEYTVQHFGAL